jgi:hypothetical protein
MGKRTPLKDFPTQGRYGVGVTAATLAGKQRLAGMAIGEPDDRVVIVTSKGGSKLLKFDAAGRRGRAARGATILKLREGETVIRAVPLRPAFVLPELPEIPAKSKGRGPNGAEANGTAKTAAAHRARSAKPPAKPAPRKKSNGRRKQ